MAKTLSISLAGLGASLLPALSFGLGLGDIQIESRLNQPLRARIEIVDVSDEEWRQIRARIAAPGVLSEAAAYPEILQSITLSTRADSSRGHFIEVKSAEALTEPLFDLPVEVAGGAVQVARNYSVLLDPASTEDTPRSLPAAVALAKTDTEVDAQARVAPHRKSGDSARAAHSSATRKVGTPAVGAVGVVQGQLASLQDMLTRMQTTIAAQDAEIAKLTAQVAARSQPQPDQHASTPRVEYLPASHPEVTDETASSTRQSWFHRWRMMFYWAAGVGAGLVLLALGAAAVVRRRNAQALQEASWREVPKKPVASQEPRSNPLAWQSTLREAQSGLWQKPTPAELGMSMSSSPPAARPAPAPERVEAAAITVATTVAIEELTQDLETDLEALSASYESERTETEASSPGIDAWRAQNDMLARDYLADTEALPFVLDPGNHAKALEAGLNEPVTETPGVTSFLAGEPAEEPLASTGNTAEIAQARSNRNREVVEVLEQSLDFEPERVDIQLKLLEIYHHEALGNRDNFDSLLRKLAATTQQLSPAQVLHVEMLQRSLRDGKHETDSDFVAEVAI